MLAYARLVFGSPGGVQPAASGASNAWTSVSGVRCALRGQDESDTPARGQAGHIRKEVVGGVPEVPGGKGHRIERAIAPIGARDNVLVHQGHVRLLLCLKTSAPLAESIRPL